MLPINTVDTTDMFFVSYPNQSCCRNSCIIVTSAYVIFSQSVYLFRVLFLVLSLGQGRRTLGSAQRCAGLATLLRWLSRLGRWSVSVRCGCLWVAIRLTLHLSIRAWSVGLMVWWRDGLMTWWSDDVMVWWRDGLMTWWSDGLHQESWALFVLLPD